MKILKFLAIAGLLSGCVAGEYDYPVSLTRNITGEEYSTPRPKSYAVRTSNEVARVGETSVRFELRHGDCGTWDCNNDRRRIERGLYNDNRDVQFGDQKWYGLSIYLPNDFVDLSPTNTTLFQVKAEPWRGPLWNINVSNGYLIAEYRPNAQHDTLECRLAPLSGIRGQWTDIVAYGDYSLQNPTNAPMLQIWSNGRLACSTRALLVTAAIDEASDLNNVRFNFGIYKSYVSRWLDRNKTRPVTVSEFADLHTQSGGTNRSPTATPFEYDWGVELPTQIVFFDEVRIGDTRAEVDVRMRE